MLLDHEIYRKSSKGKDSEAEEEARGPKNAPPDSVPTLIHRVDLSYIGQRKKVYSK